MSEPDEVVARLLSKLADDLPVDLLHISGGAAELHESHHLGLAHVEHVEYRVLQLLIVIDLARGIVEENPHRHGVSPDAEHHKKEEQDKLRHHYCRVHHIAHNLRAYQEGEYDSRRIAHHAHTGDDEAHEGHCLIEDDQLVVQRHHGGSGRRCQIDDAQTGERLKAHGQGEERLLEIETTGEEKPHNHHIAQPDGEGNGMQHRHPMAQPVE